MHVYASRASPRYPHRRTRLTRRLSRARRHLRYRRARLAGWYTYRRAEVLVGGQLVFVLLALLVVLAGR